ncbi:MAG: hypothetical protein QOF52_1939 [Propionibacteriaceae bacterium]|nr:hypothetical protein [Propionibacteriaceae bacterium]
MRATTSPCTFESCWSISRVGGSTVSSAQLRPSGWNDLIRECDPDLPAVLEHLIFAAHRDGSLTGLGATTKEFDQ